MNESVGKKTVFAVDGASTNTLADDRFKYDAAARRVDVVFTTLDRFCADHAIDRIGILKTDTEGLDVSVLRGATRMLESGAIEAVCCETTFNPEDPEVSYYAEVADMLAGYGLSAVTLYPHAAVGFGVLGKFSDVLFVKRCYLPGWAKSMTDK
jgi:hypothetical protein